MADPKRPRRKTIRIGLGVLLLVLGIRGFWSTIHPGPADPVDLRPANQGEWVGMLSVGLVFIGFGVYLIVDGMRRRRQIDSAPNS
jgi:hypothetical protein